MPRTDALAVSSAPGVEAEIFGMPGYLIRRMHQASTAIFDTEIAKAGFDLTSVQFAALTVIEAQPGLDQATLASAIAFDRVTIGGVVDRLEAKGYVRREVDKSDRRARRLYLAPEALPVLDAVRPIVRRVQLLMLEGLTAAEQTNLLRLLSKALESVGDVSRSEIPRNRRRRTTAQPRRGATPHP